ncbi:unnamed protein product [Closterium sp. NIES-53]
MQAKFNRYQFSSSEATAKAPLDEVVMDVVGPLKLGAAGAELFLTIVDVYTRMTWVYVLSKKSDMAETVKTDWLSMVERQQDRQVKTPSLVSNRHYPCNQVGHDRWALPTLVTYAGAAGYLWAAGEPVPGLIYDHKKQRWEEPTALERELAMGYGENATAAPGVSEANRRRALGNSMDVNTMRWLIQWMWRETVVSWGQEEEKGGMEPCPQGAWTCQEEEGETWKAGEAMSEEGKEAMQRLLAKHRKCFAFNLQELGRCKVKEMELKLSSAEPVFHWRRKKPHRDKEICKQKIKELLEAGLIRQSEPEYATPTVVAARKDLMGEVLSRRMCGDYRALNKITVVGFNQIKIREEDFKKTAFHGPDGLYEWLYLPFRLRNASAVFQRIMDTVLRDVECAACYIDDLVIFSTTEQQHLQDLERILVKGGQIGIQQAKVEVLDRLREPKDKEGLAAVWAVGHFRVYLQGGEFTLVTDHQPLTWLMTMPGLTGRNARWAMKLQEYDFKIKHRPGKTLQHVDDLSRNPP